MLDWNRDGRTWPHREASRFVPTRGLTWHVQIAGDGPVVLLVHGTAASTHSWSGVLPLLAERYTVASVDLPGHAFTRAPARLAGWSLPGMAAALAELLATLAIEPVLAAGHSAGAAILVRAAIDGRIAPRAIVSFNGALLPFPGVGRHLFPTLARLMFMNPVAPAVCAWRAAQPGVVADLIRSTGSEIATESLAIYERLLADREHVAAALSMMASWDLETLSSRLGALRTPLVLVAAEKDRAVPPADAETVRSRVAGAEVIRLAGLGHLAHEERPDLAARIIAERVPAGVRS